MGRMLPAKLVIPRRVFIDTGHLICLSKVQRGDASGMQTRSPQVIDAYRRTLNGIKSGAIQPVIGFEQVFEWCPGGDPSGGLEIAAVLDLAPTCYEAAYHLTAIMVEVVGEAARILNLPTIRPPSPIHAITQTDSALVFVRDNTPTLRRDWESSEAAKISARWEQRGIKLGDRAFRSVRNMVEVSAQVGMLMSSGDHAVRDWFQAGFWDTKHRMAAERGDPRGSAIERLQRSEPLSNLLLGIGAGDGLERLWSELDMARCPTLDLWAKLWWRYVGGKVQPDHGDVADITFLPAYCYTDLALTEKQMRHFICAADARYERRVFASPQELLGSMGL